MTSAPLSGDSNGDGVVDLLDLEALGAHFGQSTAAGAAAGDFNGDRVVDLLDLDVLGAGFGSTDTHSGHVSAHGDHQQEVQAAMALVPLDRATDTAIASGAWSDPAVWENGVLPTDDARVVIPAGVTLTVDSRVAAELATLRLDGTLRFATDVDTELRVDTLVSSATGCLVMGTEQDPIQGEVTASIVVADRGPIDRTFDPTGLSRGLILMGSTEIHGVAKTSWTTTAADNAPRAGDTALTLAEIPTGWRVGDTLAIAGTQFQVGPDPLDPELERAVPTGEETATVAAISGNTVTLAEPLAFDHVPAAGDLEIHIANTTRNAFIQSESAATARRGHVMFMHNPNTHLAYTGFYDLGRTDKSILPEPAEIEDGELVAGTGANVLGRYSVHFHRQGVTGNTPAATVKGSALVGTPGWGYVNHSSHVDMVDNVSYDAFGAAFYTEAGDEKGSFVNNLAIKTHGTGLDARASRVDLFPNSTFEGEDFGHSGDGFWFQGASGLTIRGNVSSGSTGSGMIVFGVEFPFSEDTPISFRSENLPDPAQANGAETVLVGQTWLGEVKDNTVYGSAIGFQMYYHRSPVNMDLPGMAEQILQYGWDFPNSRIEGLTLWNNYDGFRGLYNNNVHYKDFRVFNEPGLPGRIGMDLANRYNNNSGYGPNGESLSELVYENLDIRGYLTGFIPAPNGVAVLNGARLANETDILLVHPIQDHRHLDLRGDIQFLPTATAVDQRRNLATDVNFAELVDISVTGDAFLYYDQVTLNYGPFSGQQVYREEQLPSYVPYPTLPEVEGAGLPARYVAVSNGQMQVRFGHSTSGVVPPEDAVDAPNDGVSALIGSPSAPPASRIARTLFSSDDQIDQLVNGRADTIEATASPLAAATSGVEERRHTRLPTRVAVLRGASTPARDALLLVEPGAARADARAEALQLFREGSDGVDEQRDGSRLPDAEVVESVAWPVLVDMAVASHGP